MARQASRQDRSGAAEAAVGVVGLGIMGSAVSANLARSGFAVHGFDIDPAHGAALAEAGGTACRSAGAVAEAAEVIVTLLPGVEALEATAEAVIASAPAARTVAECSTLPIEDKERMARRLSEAGHTLLDCPLSGTGAQARTRDLVVFASGERGACERCAPVFEGFARRQVYLGAFGNGSRMKFVANLLVHIHNLAAAEAILLGRMAGLEAEQVYEVIRDSAGSSRMFEIRGPMMVARRFSPATMKNAVWRKDMTIIDAFARSLGAPTPLFDAASRLYEAALAQGRGEEDTAAVYAALEGEADAARRGEQRRG